MNEIVTLDLGLEATPIHGGLWQGSAPPRGFTVGEAGFGLLVLCADNYQPRPDVFPGVDVWKCPFDDDFDNYPSRQVLKTALTAANTAWGYLERGQPVLVTCWAGVNRSSLVTALTLHKMLGISGPAAIDLIRSKRKALTNPMFVEALNRVAARG